MQRYCTPFFNLYRRLKAQYPNCPEEWYHWAINQEMGWKCLHPTPLLRLDSVITGRYLLDVAKARAVDEFGPNYTGRDLSNILSRWVETERKRIWCPVCTTRPYYVTAPTEPSAIPFGARLPHDELQEVLRSDNKADLVVGCQINYRKQLVILHRGDLRVIEIPFAAFRPGGRAWPDFTRPALTDYGQTLCLGEYEAAIDSLLYEYDPLYKIIQDANRRDA